MKHALWIFLGLYVSAMVVACGGGTNNISESDGLSNAGCPSGSTFYMGYCMNTYGQPIAGYNGVAYQSATSNPYGYSNAGQLTITNSSVYNQLLREGFGICDQASYSGGNTSCSSFNYFMLSLQAPNVDSNTIRLTMETWPTNYNNYQYYVNAPSWSQAGSCMFTSFFFGGCYMMPNQYQAQYYHSNIMPLNMVVSNINNSKGFEARSYGPSGTISQNKLIQFQVANGKFQDGYFDFQLVYGGQGNIFATGRMVRCNTVSCGLY
ncbi:MAG: hypothetical protein KF802_07050 [Bdellovibrionaceae bacterium]|nr:hypothetical protein [Pseudobdellovibrionaceae bacterium]MBX3033072.1 hypothetical protein [Pseudobdellovibrionaceae bacterium]